MNTLSKSLLTGTLAVGVALGVGVEDLSHQWSSCGYATIL